MPEDLLNQNTDLSTGQENKKEDPKGTSDATTEIMKAVMSRLDAIEASVKASKETPKDLISRLSEISKDLISHLSEMFRNPTLHRLGISSDLTSHRSMVLHKVKLDPLVKSN